MPLESYKDIVSIHLFELDLGSDDMGKYIVYDRRAATLAPDTCTYYDRDWGLVESGMQLYKPGKKQQAKGSIIGDLIYVFYNARKRGDPTTTKRECGCWMNLVNDGHYQILLDFVNHRNTQKKYTSSKDPIEGNTFVRLQDLLKEGKTKAKKTARALRKELKAMCLLSLVENTILQYTIFRSRILYVTEGQSRS